MGEASPLLLQISLLSVLIPLKAFVEMWFLIASEIWAVARGTELSSQIPPAKALFWDDPSIGDQRAETFLNQTLPLRD